MRGSKTRPYLTYIFLVQNTVIQCKYHAFKKVNFVKSSHHSKTNFTVENVAICINNNVFVTKGENMVRGFIIHFSPNNSEFLWNRQFLGTLSI